MNRVLAYAAIAAGILMLSPFILAIAVMDWWHLWRKGPKPSPFIPEHICELRKPPGERVLPCACQDWAATMERGRQIQAQEEEHG